MPKVKPLIQRSTITQKNGYKSKIKESPIKVKIKEDPIRVKINEVLPFRVKFTNLGISGFDVPPIGIAIIGYNNYIL